jgi:hypothetical protein
VRIAIVAHHPRILVIPTVVFAVVVALGGLMLTIDDVFTVNDAPVEHEPAGNINRLLIAPNSRERMLLLQLLLMSAG